MPVPGLSEEKCKQRNRVAARRDEIEGASIQLLRDFHYTANSPGVRTLGSLPANEDEALAWINKFTNPQEPLTKDNVWVHYIEAGNNNFIEDRFMFLGESTLLNVVQDASRGFAFMNSHRTGGLSHPSELPFGRTFCGRYEESTGDNGELSRKAIVGFYMKRGLYPNGQGSPSTDDLHAGIDAATIFDVSLGLHGGNRICDICGNDLRARDAESMDYLCPHAPGTKRKMSEEQVLAQKSRGVKNGVASYTLNDSRPGEVSAVFDGAVPSAGFSKVLDLARSNELSPDDAALARHSYATLLAKGDLDMAGDEQGIVAAIQQGFANLGERLGLRQPDPATPPPEMLSATLSTHPVLAACLDLGVDSVEKLNSMKQEAADGRELLKALRDDVKAEANVAFGQEGGGKLASAIDTKSLTELQLSLAEYKEISRVKLGYKPNGDAPDRQTRPTALQHVAVDASSTDEGNDKKLALKDEARKIVAAALPGAKRNGSSKEE